MDSERYLDSEHWKQKEVKGTRATWGGEEEPSPSPTEGVCQAWEQDRLPTFRPEGEHGALFNQGAPLAPVFPPQTDCSATRAGLAWQTYLSSTDHDPGHGDGADPLPLTQNRERDGCRGGADRAL